VGGGGSMALASPPLRLGHTRMCVSGASHPTRVYTKVHIPKRYFKGLKCVGLIK
jgi:hypothetical protein